MCIRSDIVRSVQRNHIRQKIEKYHKNRKASLSFIENLEGVSISKLAVLEAWSVVTTSQLHGKSNLKLSLIGVKLVL